MLDYGLTTQQLTVICALSAGATVAAAAEEAGVHRNTISNWRRNCLPFSQALGDAQYDRALFFREKMEELVDTAFQTIRAILSDPQAPASVRLKAALAIVQTASTPPAPKKQIQLDIEKIVVKQTPAAAVTEEQLAPAPLVHNDAPPARNLHQVAQDAPAVSVNSRPSAAASPVAAPLHSLHNSEQSPRRTGPKIGRNDACPCGSGLKYKRCCLDKAA